MVLYAWFMVDSEKFTLNGVLAFSSSGFVVYPIHSYLAAISCFVRLHAGNRKPQTGDSQLKTYGNTSFETLYF